MKYELYSYDVWGNNREGYEVNDLYYQCTIEIDNESHEWTTDKQIIQALKKEGYLKKNARFSSFEIHDGESSLYITYNTNKCSGYPIYELRRKEGEE